MPDDVKDMLGLPTEKQKRSRSEPRSPRGSAKNVMRSFILSSINNLSSGQTEGFVNSEASKTIKI